MNGKISSSCTCSTTRAPQNGGSGMRSTGSTPSAGRAPSVPPEPCSPREAAPPSTESITAVAPAGSLPTTHVRDAATLASTARRLPSRSSICASTAASVFAASASHTERPSNASLP